MSQTKGEESKDLKIQEPVSQEPPTAEEIKAAFDAGGGAAAELLGKLVAMGVLLTASVMGAFNAVFGAEGLGRKAECPCGSGRMYMDCCRPIWRLVESHQRLLRREAETGKKETPEEFADRVREEAEWMVNVGVHPANGKIVFKFPDDDPMPLTVLVELLFKSWMEAFLRMSALNSRNEVLNALQQVGQQGQQGRKRGPSNVRRF